MTFKFIEAAAKCNQGSEVERVIKESTNYDPEKVKNFLMEAKMGDPKPLMYLCDKHEYFEDLTRYFFNNNQIKYLELYVIRISNKAAPIVFGTLMDLECDERYLMNFLSTVRTGFDIEQLIAEFEKRNKLRLLEHWLEARAHENNETPSLHNALAKICIDTNKDPQTFLANNPYYESKVVGKYAEDIDPHLSIIAYKRAWGECDQELVEITNKYKMYKVQAKYLVERREKALWEHVLQEDNPHRKEVIEQVVGSALPDSKNAEEVIAAVQAFVNAELHHELISLLEKIVLHNNEFGRYEKLQNLLIITAIKTDAQKVMDYINRLDNYNAEEIAKICLEERYSLHEEAFVIYRKTKHFTEAISVLLENIKSIERAAEFAERVNEPPVWSKLGEAYLNANQCEDCIDSFMKANDPSFFGRVIQLGEQEQRFDLLARYLIMARSHKKDAMIDSELLYCLAKINRLADIENFIHAPNSADLIRVGDRCYNDKLYEAAKIIFIKLRNNAKVASCFVKLKQFSQAWDAAKKANTPKTWKELCIACVQNGEYKIANAAGMHIIIHPDHLEELVFYYELYECVDEMIGLLEQAMNMDRAHVGIYTELGVLYAKYYPERLLEHIRIHFKNLNVSRLLRVCERYQLWPETVFLYSHYDEFDQAIQVMIEHSPFAWQHEQFVSLIQRVTNTDLFYKSVIFYLEE